MRVRLTHDPRAFIHRQSPGGSGAWGDVRFESASDSGSFDAWVVFERLPFPQRCLCDPGRTVFVTGEPKAVRTYSPAFLAQFAAIYTHRTDLEHPRVIHGQPALPWIAGVRYQQTAGRPPTGYSLDYDSLKAMGPLPKPRLASVISSTKDWTEWHRLRLRLFEALRERLPGQVDFYGYGHRPIEDKWDALAPYRFHVVLENSSEKDYWSEKLADTFLAGSFPIYGGCPNVGDYFPEGSYLPIDPRDPAGAVEAIASELAADRYVDRLARVWEARESVLERYNFHPVLAGLLKTFPVGSRSQVRLRPEEDFIDPARRRLKRTIKRWVFGTGPRSG